MSDTAIKYTVLIFVSIVSTAIGLILTAITLTQLWQWYITPVFDVPDITTGQALGIALTIGFATHQVNLSSLPEDKQYSKIIADAIVHPILVLIIGFVVYKLLGN